MSRRHADLVEVDTQAAPAGPVPARFRWAGRQYVVREVLARWTESGSWWRAQAVTALTSGAAVGASQPLDDRETLWWRVEADSGRPAAWPGSSPAGSPVGSSAGTGVYDLCFEQATAQWSLKRVMD